MNLLQMKLLQVALFFTLLVIDHVNIAMTLISIKRMNWNQLLLKLSTLKNEILLWETFTDIHLQTLLALLAVT